MRLIDADAALDRYYAEFEKQDICDGSQDKDWLMRCIEEAPTLTTPSEWVSAKDNPPKLTGRYICCVEDTHGHMWSIPADYLLEMKTWVGEFGEIKNKVVYWMLLPAPPNCRPPEEELKNADD